MLETSQRHSERPVAVITGGASGFGLALGQQCTTHGMDVVLLDVDGDRVTAAGVDLATTSSRRVIGKRVDVSSSADVERAAGEVADELGRCDLLWVNVGVQHFGSVESITDDEWRWVLDVNVIGAARTARAFLPLLRGSPAARIVFTASANALAPAARLGAYQASKYALVGLAETLRIELAPESIDVSIVYPSGMITRHLESSAAARPTELGVVAGIDEDLTVMMASRPLTAADITTAEDAAESALAGVLAGDAYVITHGDLEGPIRDRNAAIELALERAATRRHG